ncbi:MAG TPA: cellulose binding domain-containing protein [Polyangiaceae bacterium]|nr:cellulose binding domain-containing protein [Polyangiaceae bacterium]
MSLVILGMSVLVGGSFSSCSSGVNTDGEFEASDDSGEAVAQERDALLTIAQPEPTINLQFGTGVAADNQTLLLADPHAKATDTFGHPANRGSVYIYNRAGGVESWQALQTLRPFGPTVGEIHFGTHMALRGNLLVVSADRDALDCGTYPCSNSSDDQQQGAFYVYTRSAPGQQFTRLGTKYTEPSPVGNNRFGLLVATNGTYIAAAAGVLDGGSGTGIHVYKFVNGAVSYAYSVEPTGHQQDLTLTDSGILAVVPADGPGVRLYQLQANQAVTISNTSALGTGYSAITSSADTIALLDSSSGGRVVLAPLSSSGPGTVTTVSSLGLTSPASVTLLNNQRFFVGDRTNDRNKLTKYELTGGVWTNKGYIYSPLSERMHGSYYFGNALTATSEFVVAGDMGMAHVSRLDTNASLEGATFEKRRIIARDACGNACGGQTFGSAQYGRESALNGDVAAVTQVELGGARDQSVHIYTRTAGVWSHTAAFSYPGKKTRDVAVDGGRVYVGVGTPGSTPGSFVDGSVLVYERNGSNVWTNVATLNPSDAGSFASTFVGDTISAKGDVVAVGSYQFVYLFQRSGAGVWSQLMKLPVTPFSASLASAHTVALSDTYLAVGVPLDNTVRNEQGTVFVYQRASWTLDQAFGPIDTFNPGLHYGASLAIDGDTILIGKPDGGSSVGGNVEVRNRTGSGTTPWEFKTTLGLPTFGFDYRLGTAVSLSGDLALLGAVGDPVAGAGSGAAYLVQRVNGEWNQNNVHVLLASDFGPGGGNSFGWGVQLSGSSALISAPPTTVYGETNAGAAYLFSGLVDADSDGLLASDDCNDNDGIAVSCALGSANLSFEPLPQPQWTADAGSFTLSTTHSDGTTSAKLGFGAARLSSPLFSTTLLHEVGTALAFDIQRPTGGSNAVTLLYSVPALNITQQAIGTADLTNVPVGAWTTLSVPIPTALRNILLNQSTNIRLHLQFNVSAPNLLVDYLHFTGFFTARPAAPPPANVSATLVTTSSASNNYCMALRLGNSGGVPTTSWSVVVNLQGTTRTQGWNAAFSGNTGTITLTNNQAFNASIPAGAVNYDPSVGFCADRPVGSNTVATVVSASGQ